METKEITLGNEKAIITIPGWAKRWLSGKETGTKGVDRYKQSPTAYTCVQIRAQALSAIPYGLFPDGDIEKNPEKETHPAMVLLDEVNPEMNWIDLIRATESDMLVHGWACWWKMSGSEEPKPDKPDLLLRLSPEYHEIRAEGGAVWVVNTETQKKYTREEIVLFHDYNPGNELEPLSPLEVCASAIDVEIQSARQQGAFFSNSAMPSLLLTTEQTMQDPDRQRFQRWWNKLFKGARNAHKTGILDKGLKPTPLGYAPKDLALKDVRAEARRDICAALRVPPALAGAWEAANYASSMEQKESFYTETVIPRAGYMAGVINAELIAGYGETIKFVWLFHELPVMQDDKYLESKRIEGLVQMGVITPLAGALALGFEEKDAGIGPMHTRILDEDPNVVDQDKPTGKMDMALNKWEKKACNSLQKEKGAQVPFESIHIPDGVNEFIYDKLGGCKTKAQTQAVFSTFKE